MDIKSAWSKFAKSGEITDYLEFCKCKNMGENISGQDSKSKWNNNSRK